MRYLWLAIILLVAPVGVSAKIGVEARLLATPENVPQKVLEITRDGGQFLLIPPSDWRAEIDVESETLSFSRPKAGGSLVIRFLGRDSGNLMLGHEALRTAVLPSIADAKVVETFPILGGGHEGKAIDVTFLLKGHPIRGRGAVFPVTGGYVTFLLTCSAAEFPTVEPFFVRCLASFQPLSEDLKRQMAREHIYASEQARRVPAAGNTTPLPKSIPRSARRRPVSPIQSQDEIHEAHVTKTEPYVRIWLLGVLSIFVVYRGVKWLRRNAEIDELSGVYVTDAREVESAALPELFGSYSPQAVDSTTLADPATLVAADPSVELFDRLRADVIRVRESLNEIGQTSDLTRQREIIAQAEQMVAALNTNANTWASRPLWQFSSAIGLLLNRLNTKPQDINLSVTRTLTTAVQVMDELCDPGIHSHLFTDPPVRVLTVDDDPLCRKAVSFALEKAKLPCQIAENGKRAVELATASQFDVIFLDVEMPEMDGMEACAEIRKTVRNENTPIVFVTVHTDMETRAKSRLQGANDFIGKPFLVFDITVKAMIWSARKRLTTLASARNATASIHLSVPGAAAVVTETRTESTPAAAIVPVRDTPQTVISSGSGDSGNGALLSDRDFTAGMASYCAATRTVADLLSVTPGDQKQLSSLYFRVQMISARAGKDGLKVASQLSSKLEALLKRVHHNPRLVNNSTLNTVSRALSVLEQLWVPGAEARLSGISSIQMLVVEDEELARRAVVGALQLAFEKPDSAKDGAAAVKMIGKRQYDVIFLDIEMPEMNGFDVCAMIRKSALNSETPVVFITALTDVDSRNRALESGGNDFIAKPFLPIEITVKALTFAWEQRLVDFDACAASAA